MKKATRSKEQSRPCKANNTTKPPSKITRILAHLISGASINRFEAERIGDHCLPSTIARLSNKHNLMIQRQQELVPNGWGSPCTVTRYSLPVSQQESANAVLLALSNNQRKGANDAN